MSEPPSGPKVLMIAGAAFVASIIGRLARGLKELGGYRASALAFDRPVGRNFEDPAILFDRYDVLPALPKLIKTPFGTASAALRAIPRPPGVSHKGFKARVVEKLRWRQMYRSLPELLAGYDLYHWHCFAPDNLLALELFPSGSRIIVSLWGSDLYRTAGLDNYARQLKACPRATVFTVGSPEMRETFLAKFGREWFDRMRVVNYGADNLELIDQARDARARFLAGIGLDPGRIIVLVGNAANPNNQHMAVIEQLGRMNPSILRRIALILPMTYNTLAAYRNEVESALHHLPVPARILDEYMPELEVAGMWASCDVFVHVPVSDQFSASMCEALYAGSVLVTGAWLPYSRLRANRVHHHAMERVDQVADVLASVVNDLPAEKEKAAKSAPLLREMMAWDSVMPRWVALYNELLGDRRASAADTSGPAPAAPFINSPKCLWFS
jgi:hypothetical protein